MICIPRYTNICGLHGARYAYMPISQLTSAIFHMSSSGSFNKFEPSLHGVRNAAMHATKSMPVLDCTQTLHKARSTLSLHDVKDAFISLHFQSTQECAEKNVNAHATEAPKHEAS